MLNIPPSLQAKLDHGVTNICSCWRVQRKDGVALGFTDHDEDIIFNGLRFLAKAGLDSSQMDNSLGLSAGTTEVVGAFSHESILEVDLRNGLYDGASVEIWMVDWRDVNDRLLLDISIIGEVRHTDSVFNAELRSQTCLFDQQRGAAYQRSCTADLGDARCGVDLSSSAYRCAGLIESAVGGILVILPGAPTNEAIFAGGALWFDDGPNRGGRFSIKSYLHFGGRAHIVLRTAPAGLISPGESVTLVAGCDKRAATCHNVFSNIANFRGFPLMPGNDRMLAYPGARDTNMDGGSFFR